MWLADLISGLAVLTLGVGIVYFSTDLTYMSEYGPGPGFLPLYLGLGLIACGIAVAVKILKKPERAEKFFKPRTILNVYALIIIAVTFVLFPVFGFSIGLGLYVGATMRAIGKHRWLTCGLTAAVTAVCIHFVFGHWLDIPLPTGIVGGWIGW